MEDKTLKTFDKSMQLCHNFEIDRNRAVFLFIGNVIITFILLFWICSKDYYVFKSGRALLVLIIVLGIISIYSSFKSITVNSTIHTNLLKNKLEVKSTYISGIYTESPKLHDSEKFFKIPFNQIEKIETLDYNEKTKLTHNFIIYHSNGMIKMAINAPKEAKNMIYTLSEEMQKTN